MRIEEGRIEDDSGRAIARIDGDRIVDLSGRPLAILGKNRVSSPSGSMLAKVQGGWVIDPNGQSIAQFQGRRLSDRAGNRLFGVPEEMSRVIAAAICVLGLAGGKGQAIDPDILAFEAFRSSTE